MTPCYQNDCVPKTSYECGFVKDESEHAMLVGYPLTSEADTSTSPSTELHPQTVTLPMKTMQAAAFLKPRFTMKHLPVELWEQIFMECLPKGPQSRVSIADAPFLLLQVCSAWRSIVASPRIWATLPILKTTARHERQRDEKRIGSMVEFFLTRSFTSPVPRFSLMAGSEYQAFRASSSRLTPIWDSLLPHLHRVRHLDIRVPETSIIPLLGHSVHDLSALEAFNIEVLPEAQAKTTDGFSLENAPRLRRVSLLHITFNPRLLRIPFAQLVELVITPQPWAKAETFLTSHECLEILSESSNLQKLAITVEDVQPHAASERISSDSLIDLVISFRDSDSRGRTEISLPSRQERLARFFDLLQTPCLQRLVIGHSPSNTPTTDLWPFESFQSFLTRSACPLTSLHLIQAPMRQSELVECLRRIPSLKTLIVEARPLSESHSSVGDTLLSELTLKSLSSTPTQQALPVVPLLQDVSFRHCGKQFTEQAVVDLIQSRIGTSLETFRAEVHLPAIGHFVELWAKEGMAVQLSRDGNTAVL